VSIRVGVLLRHDDETGVSGEGVVADLIEFGDGLCVAHWRSATPSTIIFPNAKQLTAVHGHGGKTEAVFFADLPSPRNEEELTKLMEQFSFIEEGERTLDQLIEEAAEEVVEEMSEDIAESAAEKVAKRVAEKMNGKKGPSKAPEGEK
jgi:hypothetical protein